MRKIFFFFLVLGAFLIFSPAAHAGTNPTWACYSNGGAKNEGQYGNTYYEAGNCSDVGCQAGDCGNNICDDNYADSTGSPCAKTSALTCKCTGSTSFSCGVTAPNEFSRSCGRGQVCDPTKTTAWPCIDGNSNPSLVPTGSFVDPCPNGFCTTAFGIIKVTDPADFIGRVFQILLGTSGGIALILIIISGYQLAISQGNPEKVKNARERLISAMVGLFFIIFSVSILQIIGVNILALPGFGAK